jgi:hypothetical protein
MDLNVRTAERRVLWRPLGPGFLFARPEIPLHNGLARDYTRLRSTLPRVGLAPGNRREVARCEFTGVGESTYCSVEPRT